MLRLLSVSTLALSLAMIAPAHAEGWFRLNIAPIVFARSGEDGGPPGGGVNDNIAINVAEKIDQRVYGHLSASVAVSGIDASYAVSVAGLPAGSTWNADGQVYGAGTITWPSAIQGTYHPTVEVRDVGGALVASAEIELVVHPALTAAVTHTTSEVAVGEELVIEPTVSNVLPGGSVRWSLSPTADWLGLNDQTGAITVDTSEANSLVGLRLTAIDQSDFDDATTSDFAVTVKSASCEPWTARAVPDANTWTAVGYGNGKFVALSNDGTRRLMTSPDGVTWTPRALPSTLQSGWSSVAYGNGMFVAVASSVTTGFAMMRSVDGENWVHMSPPIASAWKSVTFGGGRFVAVGNDKALTSTDGVIWSSSTIGSINTNAVTYGNGRFVVVGAGGNQRTAYSLNGSQWTMVGTPKQASWGAVAYGNGLFVAASYDGQSLNDALVSSNGASWSVTTAPMGSWRSIAFGNDRFVALSTGKAITSADGANWEELSAEAGWWSALAFGDGTFVAVGQSGATRAMTSACGS